MKRLNSLLIDALTNISSRYFPIADFVSHDLPLTRLLRLSLFQVSVGMAIVLIYGTLNRVMIVELNVIASLVAVMVSLPLLFAPLRVLVGFRSDHYRSYLGWKRVPFLWFGTLIQFGGLAIMPFALILLSGDTHGPMWVGQLGAALAFLLTGIGLHTTQTSGLALATDLSAEEKRPRVVALLYVMLLLGMMISALCFGALLENFSQLRLIKVVQGAALLTMLINIFALWKQEARNPANTAKHLPRPKFLDAWQVFSRENRAKRYLIMVGLGTLAFSMQDILLEPYGGQILNLSVSATTMLTAILAAGTLCACVVAAHLLHRKTDPHRLAAAGILIGVFAFSCVIFAAPLHSALLFRFGTALIGFGGGLFAVGTLIEAMSMDKGGQTGLSLGAWGAVQATAAGTGVVLGGVIRDIFSGLAESGLLGPAMDSAVIGYSVVYHLEIALLFATLIVIGPMVNSRNEINEEKNVKFGLAEFPG
ncbi:MAG: BCD family MFS transporter [Pseudomonadota bacterium]